MAGEIKSNKREQLDKDKTRIFIIISVAAVVTVASLAIARGYWARAGYLNKVVGMQETARDTLKANTAAVDKLEESYDDFVSQDPNLIAGSVEGDGIRDGDNATLVLDALPSKYDFPALASSLEKLLAGRSITAISGDDDSINQISAAPGAPVEMPFSFGAQASYDSAKTLLDEFKRSIRPFYFDVINLRGSNDLINIEITGRTFFMAEQGVQISESQVN